MSEPPRKMQRTYSATLPQLIPNPPTPEIVRATHHALLRLIVAWLTPRIVRALPAVRLPSAAAPDEVIDLTRSDSEVEVSATEPEESDEEESDEDTMNLRDIDVPCYQNMDDPEDPNYDLDGSYEP